MGESLNATDTTQAEIDLRLHIIRTETDSSSLPILAGPQLEQIIHSIPDWGSSDTADIQGVAGDTAYTLALPERPGSHNRTYIATLHGEDDIQLVLKWGPDVTRQTQTYMQEIHEHPLIADYTAHVYGEAPDRWIALEYLDGLSYERITEKMRRSDTFAASYAKAAYQTIDKITSAGLDLADVKFTEGHNVILDDSIDGDWRLRFLEHDNIRPAVLNLQPQEASFQLICKELTATMPRYDEQADQGRLRFGFALMQQALTSHKPDSYYLRPMQQPLSHPEGSAATTYISMPVSALVVPRSAQQLHAGYIFSPDLVASVQADDFDTFCQLVLAGQHVAPLAADDPRSQPNTIDHT